MALIKKQLETATAGGRAADQRSEKIIHAIYSSNAAAQVEHRNELTTRAAEAKEALEAAQHKHIKDQD